MSNDLRDMIREMIETTVREAVAETVAEVLGASTPGARLVTKGNDAKPQSWADAAFQTGGKADAPEAETVGETRRRVSKRARQTGPRVEYTVANVTNRKVAETLREKAKALVGNDMIVFKLLAKGKPRTMPAVRDALNMKGKAAESSLHQLRVAGLIVSQPIDGR